MEDLYKYGDTEIYQPDPLAGGCIVPPAERIVSTQASAIALAARSHPPLGNVPS